MSVNKLQPPGIDTNMYQCTMNNTSEKSKRTDFGCKFPDQEGLYSKIKFQNQLNFSILDIAVLPWEGRFIILKKILALTTTSMSTFSLEINNNPVQTVALKEP